MFKFFLFLRHRDVESDILTAGIYKEEGAAIWKTFKDKAYSRSLVGVRKLREAAQIAFWQKGKRRDMKKLTTTPR
jgi:hypothetical protein